MHNITGNGLRGPRFEFCTKGGGGGRKKRTTLGAGGGGGGGDPCYCKRGAHSANDDGLPFLSRQPTYVQEEENRRERVKKVMPTPQDSRVAHDAKRT